MRLLACIPNYGSEQSFYLHQVLIALDNMVAFKPHVVLHTTVPVDLSRYSFTSEQVRWDPELKKDMPFKHRKTMMDRQDDFDLFLYTENDVLVTEDNLLAFCEANSLLPSGYIAGFVRYERRWQSNDAELYLPDLHPNLGPVLDDVINVGTMDCIKLANRHHGGFVLTRSQLKSAIASRGFDAMIPGRTLNLEVAATSVYFVCGLTKVTPLRFIDRLMVHHLADKYVNSSEEPWKSTPPLTLTRLKELARNPGVKSKEGFRSSNSGNPAST